MSLQVWLPLSGSTINLGLNDLEASAVGDIMYASGLFGGTSFNAGSGSIVEPIDSIPEKMSVSVWFKQQVVSATKTFLAFGGGNDRIDFYPATNAFVWANSGIGILPDGTTLFTLAPDGEWHHLVITADGSTVNVYLDTVKVFTSDQDDSNEAAFGSNANIYIGAKSSGEDIWAGYIQDFKFFDSILSTREIFEISKAMMLEYTFNHNGFGNENLLVGTETDTTVSGSEVVNRVENDTMHATLEPGTYTLSAQTTGTWSSINHSSAVTLTGNAADVPTGLELYTKSGDEVASRTFYNLSENGSATVTISNAGTYYVGVIVYGDGLTTASATVSRVKLESGDKATPWLPHKSSQLYEDMQIGTVEQDTSGNNLDGTISATTPDWSSDSALFSGSYDFSNGSYIESPVLDVSNVSQFTVSVWAKAGAISGKSFFGFTSGSKFNLSAVDGVFGIYDVANSVNRVFGSGISVADYLDEWHQYVVTGDGSVEKLYIDGEYMGDASAYVSFGLSKIMINGYNSTNRLNGLMSDFRVYSKALSSDTISAMYHQKAAVDNTGRVYGAEFIAGVDTTNRLVSKTGVINTAELTTFNTEITTESVTTDDASVFKFGKDKIIATEVIEA